MCLSVSCRKSVFLPFSVHLCDLQISVELLVCSAKYQFYGEFMHALLKANPTEYWIIHAVNIFMSILKEMGEKPSNEIENRALLRILAHKEQAQHDKWADLEMFILISYKIRIPVCNKKQMVFLNRGNVVKALLINIEPGRGVAMIIGLLSKDSCYSVIQPILTLIRPLQTSHSLVQQCITLQ